MDYRLQIHAFCAFSGLILCWGCLIINSHNKLELAPHFLFFSSDKRVFHFALYFYPSILMFSKKTTSKRGREEEREKSKNF